MAKERRGGQGGVIRSSWISSGQRERKWSGVVRSRRDGKRWSEMVKSQKDSQDERTAGWWV